MDVRREGGIADDPECRGDQERREERPVRHHIPLLLRGSLDRAVNQEGIVVAHEGERHYTDGWNDSWEIGKPPAIGPIGTAINHACDYTIATQLVLLRYSSDAFAVVD